ncbi:MAG TPA: glucosamine-6-phosphate deaminase [Thermoclostridium sp.]|nr:glucosamine-6-phosphate deaminase [Thermoclostridium sp.]
MDIIKVKNYEEMSKKAANIIAAQIVLKPHTVLGLATGSTPIGTYAQLIELCKNGNVDFSQVTTINLDEYYGLDPSHDQSYRYYMNKNLLTKVNINLANTYLPNGKVEDVEAECTRYDKLIEELGGIDLQLLGIGHNGHIGFNEPSDEFVMDTYCVNLGEITINANARFFENRDDVPKRALTLGIKPIMQAKKILLIASGDNKRDILKKALFGPVTPLVPASILQLHKDLTIITPLDL